MKNIGIWLDKDKAYIVTLKNELETMNIITSNVEHYNAHGGSGTKLKGGPQDVVQDSKYLEREKHQLKKYFNNIVSEVKNADAIVIYGPAGTNDKLSKDIKENYPELSAKIKAVIKADSMTENQVKALVRGFFT